MEESRHGKTSEISREHRRHHEKVRSHRSPVRSREDLDIGELAGNNHLKRHSTHEKTKENSKKRSREETHRRHHRSKTTSPKKDTEDDIVWIEKSVAAPETIIGPMPVLIASGDERSTRYGEAMLPGEASAMAKYIKAGKRIPRRGEIGLTNEQIDHFEDIGYVMSGNRHRRMNAVRIRKETQVLTVEGKRAQLQETLEERARREAKVLADFREMLAQRAKFEKEQQQELKE